MIRLSILHQQDPDRLARMTRAGSDAFRPRAWPGGGGGGTHRPGGQPLVSQSRTVAENLQDSDPDRLAADSGLYVGPEAAAEERTEEQGACTRTRSKRRARRRPGNKLPEQATGSQSRPEAPATFCLGTRSIQPLYESLNTIYHLPEVGTSRQ